MDKQELPEYRHTAERLAQLERSIDGLKSKHDMLFGMHTDQHDFIMDETNKLEAKIASMEAETARLASKLATLEIAFNALEQHAEQHIAELEDTVKRLERSLKEHRDKHAVLEQL